MKQRSIFAISLGLLSLSGCAHQVSTPKAHLVIPPECVQNIRCIGTWEQKPDGLLCRGHFKGDIVCTRVEQDKPTTPEPKQ